ncbi:MAG TPA: IscS subfamily cysteine desulfurase [Alphaproteobacteria bacterium]|nr:IscS subfamily cysteine desulfurase [Alphaproteobacteria bacterium]
MSAQFYFDYQATTPCDPKVVEKMLPYFCKVFGNPHSKSHSFGWTAEEAVEKARENVASIIGADSREIIFTSGATESNNLTLKGVLEFYKDKKNHLITCVTEHKCVLESARYLQSQGVDVTFLPVKPNGQVDLDTLKNAIKEETALVSIMAVNNEVGVIQPLKEIGAICKEKGVFFHTDAAQAIGKIPLDVNEMGIDLLSISGHKIYGPKGIGALYIRRKDPRVRLKAQLHGGSQERGFRSGTLSPALCVGLGEACLIAKESFEKDIPALRDLTNYLKDRIFSNLTHIHLNGDAFNRVPGNLNISFLGVEGEGLLGRLKEFALSSGSACTSSSLEPSYVLRALGLSEDIAHTSIRFGLGRFTKKEEVDYLIEKLIKAVTELRALSPLWEMIQEGVDLNTIEWNDH